MNMLKTLENEKLNILWLKFHTAAVVCIFVYFALYQFAPNYFGLVYSIPYRFCALALILGLLLFRRFKDGVELKLLFFYCLWVTIMRVVDGSVTLEGVPDGIFNRWVALPLCAFALLAPAEKRLKLLDVMAVIYAAAYTILGVICIYAAPEQLVIINPISGITLCEFIGGRLYVFWKNCNAVSPWFMMGCWLLVYLFFRSRKTLWKALIAPAFIVNYTALALTYGRSSQLGFALGFGMLAAAIALRKLPVKKLIYKVALFLLCMCICIPVYKGFGIAAGVVESFAPEIPVITETATAAQKEEIKEQQLQTAVAESLKNRGFSSAGRIELWISSICALAEEPSRLITGKFESIIDTNEYMKVHDPGEFKIYGIRLHHHRSYVEMFLYSGVPGFALILGFFLLLVIKMVKLYFCQRTDMAQITVIVMLTGLMIYNLFESSLMHIYDIRTVAFFVFAGYVLAFEKELGKNM